MLVWCSGCGQFQGEKTPFDNYQITMALCAKCARASVSPNEHPEVKRQHLQEIQDQLWKSAQVGDERTAGPLLAKSKEFGFRGVDILVGVVSPLLWRLGDCWERGEFTVAEEHQFTQFCEFMVSLVTVDLVQSGRLAHTTHPQILLMSVEGNLHTLGVRIVHLWLTELGMPSACITPGVPVNEIAKLINQFKPQFVGLSVSMPDQEPVLKKTIAEIKKCRPRPHIIFLGGFAVKSKAVKEQEFTVPITQVGELVAFIESAHKKPSTKRRSS